MNMNPELFEEISLQGEDLITTKQLIDLGLFTSGGQASSLRERGDGPPFLRNWNGHIVYPKVELLKWLKENDLSSVFRKLKKPIYRDTRQNRRYLNLPLSEELLSKLIAASQKESSFITTGRWVVNFLEKTFVNGPSTGKDEDRRGPPPSIVEAQQYSLPIDAIEGKSPNSKFLTISLFCETYPSFKRHFFRKMIKHNPEFIRKVMQKGERRYYVNVEAFWKFLKEDSIYCTEKKNI